MSTESAPKKDAPQESDLLVPFESQIFPDEYKQYYKTKRNNFFASVQKFPGMWKYFPRHLQNETVHSLPAAGAPLLALFEKWPPPNHTAPLNKSAPNPVSHRGFDS